MSRPHYFFRSLCIVSGVLLATLSLGSCQLTKNQLTYDRAAEKEIQDYRDALTPQPMPPDETSDAPDFRPVISTPADLKLPAPLVTVSVNQTVSLRDLMFELADQAGVDLEMDPQIRGSIIFTAKERPFNEVIDRICEMSGLRYKFENNVLRIELDRPYIKNYQVDHMNITRTGSSNINNTVTVSGSGESNSSSSGSGANIANSYAGDFWKDLDTGMKQILTSSDTYLSLATLADPVATPVAPIPPPVDPNNPNAPPPLPGAPGVPGAPSAATAPPSLNVSVPPSSSEPLIPNAPATYSISRQTGTVTVFASERQHKLVQKFLDTLRHISMTQILIEAKVLEISLNDSFQSGIDWGAAFHDLTGLASFKFAAVTGPTPPSFTANLDFTRNFQPVIQALSTYGTVRALSSPRVTVLNNQPTMVNVAENQVYFNIKATTTTSGSPPVTTTTFDVTQKTLPLGVLMNVVPTANPDTGEIILAVRPTVTSQVGTVEDPSIELNAPAATVTNDIPIVSVQEIDSIIKMQSGQTMVMGGMMRDRNDVNAVAVPILGDIPLVGNLFRNQGDVIVKTELVIFMKATIVPGANADEVDRKLYKSFSMDRRPSRL